MSNEKFKVMIFLCMASLILNVFSISRDMAKGNTLHLLTDIVSVGLVLSVVWTIQKSRKKSN